MTYSRNSLGASAAQMAADRAATGTAAIGTLSEADRRALQAKLNTAMAAYVAMASQVSRLIGGVPVSRAKFAEAKRMALSGGPAGLVRMSREQLASLVVGTFGKVQELLRRSTALLTVASDPNVARVVDNSIRVAERAMARLARLSSALQRVSGGTSGLGQVTGETAAEFSIAVGVLLTLTGVGAIPGIMAIAGGVGYLIASSDDEMDAQLSATGRAMAQIDQTCAARPDRAACETTFHTTMATVAAADAQRIRAQGEAAALLAQSQGDTGGWFGSIFGVGAARSIGGAGAVVIVGSAAAVGLYLLYLTWPLLSGARRATASLVSKNRRRARRRRRSR